MVVTNATAQRRQTSYNNYIKQYAPLAVEQMKQHNIPASITLAQGLLESGAGLSTLAKRFERVDLLQKRGEWKEDSRGLGLKKTKPEA